MKLKLTKALAVLLCAVLTLGILPGFTSAYSSNSAPTTAVAGDINGDYAANNKDLTRLFQYLSGWNVNVNEDALDVNGDQKVNNKDLTRLFQFLSDWDVQIYITAHCDHDGGTEIRGYKAASCTEEGYTGDTYCLLCQRRISKGEVTPVSKHTGGTATCHSKAVCTRCGKEYGELNANNHSGGTELRSYQAATCGEGGYSGDTYCLGCGKIISAGENTNPTHNHKNTAIQNAKEATCWSLGYTGDLVCTDCGMVLEWGEYTNETDIHLHTHIENAYSPTCTAYGFTGDTYCDDCGKCIKWGTQLDPTGHLNTELRGGYPATCTTAGYTGDTYCTECGELTKTGAVIEPAGHTGESATYYRKGICEVCGEVYEDYKDISAYDQINENQKLIYAALNAAITNLEMDSVELPFVAGTSVETMESDIRVALHAVAYDKPEYFWMPKNYIIQQTTDKLTGEHLKTQIRFSAYANDQTRGYYNVTADERASMQAELDEKIEEVLALAQNYETDFQKELFLHDYLCEHISYDYNSSEDPNNADFRTYTIYGALINGTCVCEGYSRAMQLLCRRLGISCGLVSGIGNGGPHMWNIIRIGDGLYYLDVTFDDSLENSGIEITYLHNYFNITTEKLEEDHELDGMYAVNADYSDPNTDFNFFDTHGDYTEYYYYTASGAYIYANDASAAAQFALEKWNNGYTMVEYEYANISLDNAKTLLANKLVGNLRIAGTAALPFGNYVIVVFRK